MKPGPAKLSSVKLLLAGLILATPCSGQERTARSTDKRADPGQQRTAWKTQPPLPGRVNDKPFRPSQFEKEIIAKLRRFFEVSDKTQRREIARQIELHKAYDPASVSDWLHQAGLHRRIESGVQTITVTLEDGEKRAASIRIPRGYTPEKRWPLILAYHHTGGTGEDIIQIVARSLDKLSDQYVVAASTDYLPLNIDSKRSWRPEQRLVLRELRKLVHVDSDRIYVTGFSQGCYASWSYATFYGDELAGAAPVACTFDAAPEVTGLWELLLPNVSNVPILHVWGSEDNLPVYGIDLRTVTGVASRLNETRVTELTKELKLDVMNYRVRGGGHAYEPPEDLFAKLLEKRRNQYPLSIRHRFRYLVQGRAYWLEALSWDGDQWGLRPRELSSKVGESREQVIGRMISELSGQLDGEIAGQEIRILHQHVGSLIVWLGDGMFDWNKPIRVTANGQEAFHGEVKRDLYVCLTEAARTYDFDRLRWAGLRLVKDGRVAVLTTDDLPEVVYEKPSN
jgi:predicted esterase